MFDFPREEVANLLPCALCSAPFDPATLPSHVYDPYQSFLLFSQHASICASCFAEELAKRTRPDPNTFGSFIGTSAAQQNSERAGKPLIGNAKPRNTFHRKSNSLAAISRGVFPDVAEEANNPHRRANSSINFTKTSTALKRESRSHDALRRQDSLRESNTSYETYRHRPSTSIGYSTTSQKTSPELPNGSRRSSPEIPRRVASRNHSLAQTIRSSPDLSRCSQDKTPIDTRPSTDTSRKSADNVRRKVSFHKGTPVAQSFNPQSPPYHAAARGPSAHDSSLPSSDEPAASPVVRSSPVTDPPIPPSRSNRWSAIFGVHYSHSVIQEATPSSSLSWSSWRIRRRQEREAREHTWQRRKEQQRLKKLREDKERGIGLDLFCPHCQQVVKTAPKWRDGSCCMLYSSCLFVCTGPLCLCLLLPCASRQVLDVDGRCPDCTTTLSTWNRRKNRLTILTWAGVRNPEANRNSPYLAPRPLPEHRLERVASARTAPISSAAYVHYSRPRTTTVSSQVSRPRNNTSSSMVPPTPGLSSNSTPRPRTMSSAQQTATASSTARTSGGSPPTTTRSSPSSRMAASATGTTSSSNRTGSSSNRTAVSASTGTATHASSASTGNTLINAGPAPMTTAAVLYEEDNAASVIDEHDETLQDLEDFTESDIVATDFAAFLQDPVGQGYLHDNHAITHAALGHAVQIIVPQRLLDDIEMQDVGRAIG